MANLRLRNFREDDFEAFHALCSDYDVVKMVSSWPYPAEVEFSRMRMNTPEAKAGLVSVIECDGQFSGNIGGIQGGLGYMLAKPFWGRGIATWAVREKLRECEVEGQDFELTRAKWALSQPLHIETDRLVIRPFELTDGAELAALMNDRDIARMMATIPHPFSVEQATQWIVDRPFDRSTGFGAKITLKDGTLIGFLGLGGDPVNTAYALVHKYWGKGYATEAMRAFLEDLIAVHALEEVTAEAFIDNLASQKVLEKLGFEHIGKKMHKASGRLEEAPLFLYRLRSAKFGTS